eukprot:Em0022g955a
MPLATKYCANVHNVPIGAAIVYSSSPHRQCSNRSTWGAGYRGETQPPVQLEYVHDSVPQSPPYTGLGRSRGMFSVKHPPLLPICLDPVVPDELHLFLRVMDILLGNVIAQVIAIDIKAVKKHSDPLLGATIQKLVAKIQSCGVPFQIWKKDDNSKLDWT